MRERLGLGSAPLDRFEAQGNRDGLVELHGALKGVAVSLTKIAQDLVLMGSGPRTGLVELRLPELQKGSSIMPGKVNPVIPEVVLQVAAQVIGNDTAVTVAGTQGNFELNVRVPMMARNVFDSITLLTSAARLLAEKCVDGIEANEESLRHHAESTPAIATALNPYIGYDLGTEIVQEAVSSSPHDPRGGDREGRRRGDAGQGARPARDGARVGYLGVLVALASAPARPAPANGGIEGGPVARWWGIVAVFCNESPPPWNQVRSVSGRV